jgi:anti-sigma regulatory factor (Ser/Thr protein kinase)
MTGEDVRGPGTGRYRHEAWLYRGETDLVARARMFVLDGLEADEAVLVVLPSAHLDAIREDLGDAAASVSWSDMADIGRNPALIISAWRAFIDRHAGSGRSMRGIGEPAFAGRSDDELAECLHHEALLNVAVADDEPLWLACPYDVSSLPPEVVDGAHTTHPVLEDHSGRFASDGYRGLDLLPDVLTAPLPEPTSSSAELRYHAGTLAQVREFTEACARGWGVPEGRIADVVLAVNELAANSVRHASGEGRLRSWRHGGSAVFEVHDRGHIADPMVGRRRPAPTRTGGRGVWMVNHLCDLVQVRSDRTGTTVRAHVTL